MKTKRLNTLTIPISMAVSLFHPPLYTRPRGRGKTKHILLILVAALVLSACRPNPSAPTPTQAPKETQPGPFPVKDVAQSGLARISTPDVQPDNLTQLASGNSAFAFDLYQSIRSQDGNLLYSPYSISLALAMAYAGARGQTGQQMADILHYALPQERLHPAFNALDQELASRNRDAQGQEGKGFQLNVVNSTWAQRGYPFLPQYLDLLAQNYGAGLRLEDFTGAPEPARLHINEWVSQQTKDKIKDLIPRGAITPMTRLVLANAVYFKAAWLYPFEKTATQEANFILKDGNQVSVPMMSLGTPKSLFYAHGSGYQAVELPYAGDKVSMLLLVPDTGKFDTFEAGLNAAQIEAILKDLNPKMVALKLPKFQFEASFGLVETLSKMGMRDAFDPQLADFSGMDGSHNLYISSVLHKAFVAVDEEGTEAAAATAVIVGETAMPVMDVELTVDRPFIFLIRDKPSGTVLFVGRVLNPTQ